MCLYPVAISAQALVPTNIFDDFSIDLAGGQLPPLNSPVIVDMVYIKSDGIVESAFTTNTS